MTCKKSIRGHVSVGFFIFVNGRHTGCQRNHEDGFGHKDIPFRTIPIERTHGDSETDDCPRVFRCVHANPKDTLGRHAAGVVADPFMRISIHTKTSPAPWHMPPTTGYHHSKYPEQNALAMPFVFPPRFYSHVFTTHAIRLVRPGNFRTSPRTQIQIFRFPNATTAISQYIMIGGNFID